jgi:hypothetical protein
LASLDAKCRWRANWAALFYAQMYQRLLRPGFSELADARLTESSPLARAFTTLQRRLDAYADQKIAA